MKDFSKPEVAAHVLSWKGIRWKPCGAGSEIQSSPSDGLHAVQWQVIFCQVILINVNNREFNNTSKMPMRCTEHQDAFVWVVYLVGDKDERGKALSVNVERGAGIFCKIVIVCFLSVRYRSDGLYYKMAGTPSSPTRFFIRVVDIQMTEMNLQVYFDSWPTTLSCSSTKMHLWNISQAQQTKILVNAYLQMA